MVVVARAVVAISGVNFASFLEKMGVEMLGLLLDVAGAAPDVLWDVVVAAVVVEAVDDLGAG